MRKEVIRKYKELGVDVKKALKTLAKVKVSIHCWQMDDVQGFENAGPLTGGIQTTGNYPGKARNFLELTQDLDKALSYVPGSKKINLHAIYRVSDEFVDRSEIEPKHFEAWVNYAKERGYGLDFNPTCFSSEHVKDNMTLSSPDDATRAYWIKHCIASRKIAEYFGRELGQKSLCNIWIPDGLKDIPGDRMGPRARLKDSLDQIFSVKVDRRYMDDSVESKVFGIGMESYTTGSHEFYMGYAMKNNVLCLLDTGHFHPTENVADKIPSLLLFSKRLALHVSRPVRWDSDHVLKLNDELQDVANELVRCNALDRTYIGLDYFDASINRVAALALGARNMQKALLIALLTPWERMKELQDKQDFTQLFILQEQMKLMPFDEVWNEYCASQGVLADETSWYEDAMRYEKEVLNKRG